MLVLVAIIGTAIVIFAKLVPSQHIPTEEMEITDSDKFISDPSVGGIIKIGISLLK
jgi:hypothetical protein